jgi:hypothetical protein
MGGKCEMTKIEIIDKINQLNTEASGSILAMVYFVLEKENGFEIVLADMEAKLQKETAHLWMALMQENLNDEEKEVINLSIADNRKNTIYQYDLEEFSQALMAIKQPLLDDKRKFDFQHDKFDEIFGFIIKIGLANNNISIFKKNYPISLIKKDTFNLTRFGNSNRLVKVKEDIVKIGLHIDFFIIGEFFFICNLNLLERYFGFHEIIKKEALKSVNIIDGLDLLDDIEPLKSDIGNTSFARKLIKTTSASRVIGKVPNSAIIHYTKTNSVLKGKFLYNTSGDKIILQTKKAKEYFIKLMNDDILISELTKNYYDSLAKDFIIAKKVR